MSSFSQWYQAYQKSPTVKQVSWVCGSETVLVDDIVETLVSNFEDTPWSRTRFTVGTDRERDIWADIEQHPVDGRTKRVVVVRHAELLKRPERIVDWMKVKSKNPLTHVVFVSDEPELTRLPPTEEQKKSRKKADLVPHLAAMHGKALTVECKPFTQATAKHAVSWLQSKVEIRQGVAGKLLERANGDLRLVRDAIVKLSAFPDEISDQTVNFLFSAQPRMSFVDALLCLDKRMALLALEHLPESEYSATIGLLDQRLEVVGTIRDLLVAHRTRGQIAKELGNLGFLTNDFLPIAKNYDPKRRAALRRLLEQTDAALQAGAPVGPMQSLVHFW